MNINDDYTELLVELANFVKKLNNEVYSHNKVLPGTIFVPFELLTNGEDISVSFLDQKVWDTENYDSSDISGIKEVMLEEANGYLQSFKMMRIK